MVVLGVVTALGGEMLRDVLVGRAPAAISGCGDVTVALLGVGLSVLVFSLLARGVR